MSDNVDVAQERRPLRQNPSQEATFSDRSSPVVTGLDVPWGFDFLPGAPFIITEKHGRPGIAGS